MPLNKKQQSGFIDVISHINHPTEKYAFLIGGAGTGKTYVISKIADDILKHKNTDSPLNTVAITATTNKAKAVIAAAMPNRSESIKTIYSFMNLRVKENFSNGTTTCIPTPKWKVHSNTFLIIDECSMIDRQLLEYIEAGTDKTCKILFVGDENQLAPIKEEISTIFNKGYNASYLTEPVRNNSQPALIALCEQAKQTVLTGKFTPILPVPGVIDLIDGPTMQGLLEREYSQEDPNKRILCYTNNKVIGYNNYVRDLRGYTEPYVIGEMLTNNTAAESAGDRLYTDQIVSVFSISKKKISTDIIRNESFEIVTLQLRDPTTLVIYEVKAFYKPEIRTKVLKYYSSRKEWDKYFIIKNKYPDLRSIAASTTHKAQGSTYDSVIVDLADIGKSTNKSQTARMQYVALSRPKERIWIKGVLPERYF